MYSINGIFTSVLISESMYKSLDCLHALSHWQNLCFIVESKEHVPEFKQGSKLIAVGSIVISCDVCAVGNYLDILTVCVIMVFAVEETSLVICIFADVEMSSLLAFSSEKSCILTIGQSVVLSFVSETVAS